MNRFINRRVSYRWHILIIILGLVLFCIEIYFLNFRNVVPKNLPIDSADLNTTTVNSGRGKIKQATQTFIDVCSNIEGIQKSIPVGMSLNGTVCNAVVIVPIIGQNSSVDICSNIEGVQTIVPSGMEIIQSDCIVIQTPTNNQVNPQSETNIPSVPVTQVTPTVPYAETNYPNWFGIHSFSNNWNGQYKANGAEISLWFEFGSSSTNLNYMTSKQTLPANFAGLFHQKINNNDITSLYNTASGSNTLYFRLVVQNSLGISYGNVLHFNFVAN